uniref:Uncharacterized protein n=1 Tax=Tanacetum cinerariifolium TaxID=118510 RepID=A0A699GW78_TANCI|nr:hypothetical protein [Tanacetum cinerariifolium]
MGSGLSKLPLPLKVDANDDGTNHNFPSFVHKVVSNDDLLMEILLRLPILSLHLFKPVCKQWLYLITSSSFTLTRTRIPTVDPPFGLFIKRWPHNDYIFVSFDPRIPAKRSIHPLACLGGRIKQSCNGLLLCYIATGNKYYVCNPSISMFKMLPPIHDLHERNGYQEMNIAFDPIKSLCYKVVHVGRVEDEDDENDYFTRIQTYSSETGVWSVSGDRFPNLWFDGFGHGIYWNGAIHWLTFHDPFHVITLDIVDNPVLTKIQTTLPVSVKGHVHYNRKLLKSHGSLLFLCKDGDSQHLNIFEMKNEYCVWSVKYFVNLDDIMRPYPTLKMPTNWLFRYHMLNVVLGQ